MRQQAEEVSKPAGFTITIDKGGVGKSRLGGAVDGGGPLLKLRSSGGDVAAEPALRRFRSSPLNAARRIRRFRPTQALLDRVGLNT